ncbi:fatty acyl-AMP ligase [Streptomyces sp. NPDC048436]|uniref:fatty acyl-AMP ligase n=1 Tax=Streptomyces sp. NPDC048436 TaxID=3365550 RepID=UPI003716D449
MPAHRNFTDLVLEQCIRRAEQDAYVFLHDGGTVSDREHLTFGGLDAAARRLASWLQERDLRGERVLMLYDHGLAFTKAFTGCLYAGVVAVPSPLPGGHGQAFSRVTGIVKDAGVRVVLTDSASLDEVTGWLESEELTGVEVLATDQDGYGDPERWQPPTIEPDDLAFLQYTSGSTSEPKGVMVSHGNLLANQEVLVAALGTVEGDVLGSWLPYFHDMGLIGFILHAQYTGCTLVQMAPISFLKRPHRWLQMITDHRIAVCGGPNFAYDLCTRRVTDEQLATLDLSSWKSAVNGSEPIRASSMRDFARRFAGVGFRPGASHPGYGMAEATLGVTGSDVGVEPVVRASSARQLERDLLRDAEPGEPVREVVSCGRPHGFDMLIVEPESRVVLPEGSVGEIWLAGQSVARGYWKRDEDNQEVFSGRTADGRGPYLRTGDLGVLSDGELYVTGRRKELLIFQGRNLYPQDIEQSVQSFLPEVARNPGAVFTVETTGRDVAVVVQEVRPHGMGAVDLEALAQTVQWGVSREFDIPVGGVLLARPGTVRKTTSGKIQRALMRELFLAGELKALRELLTPEVAGLIDREVSGLSPV